MFFGTRAKVYFFPCACAPAPNASSPATATPIVRTLIGVPSLWLSNPAFLRRALAADPLEQNRQHYEQADKRALPIGIHPCHEEGVPNHFDQSCADKGAVSPTLAAHEVRTADHGRCDDAELVSLTERVDGRPLPPD